MEMSKRKKDQKEFTSNDYQIAITIIAVSVCLVVYMYLVMHSHSQLGLEQANSKLFITNKLRSTLPETVGKIEVRPMFHGMFHVPFQDSHCCWLLQDKLLANFNYTRKDVYNLIPDFSLHNNNNQNDVNEMDAADIEKDDNNLDMNPILDNSIYHVLQCEHADLVSFWKPPTKADLRYVSPYFDPKAPPKYVTFEPGKYAKRLL